MGSAQHRPLPVETDVPVEATPVVDAEPSVAGPELTWPPPVEELEAIEVVQVTPGGGVEPAPARPDLALLPRPQSLLSPPARQDVPGELPLAAGAEAVVLAFDSARDRLLRPTSDGPRASLHGSTPDHQDDEAEFLGLDGTTVQAEPPRNEAAIVPPLGLASEAPGAEDFDHDSDSGADREASGRRPGRLRLGTAATVLLACAAGWWGWQHVSFTPASTAVSRAIAPRAVATEAAATILPPVPDRESGTRTATPAPAPPTPVRPQPAERPPLSKDPAIGTLPSRADPAATPDGAPLVPSRPRQPARSTPRAVLPRAVAGTSPPFTFHMTADAASARATGTDGAFGVTADVAAGSTAIEAVVRQALTSYRQAYAGLDAEAAHHIWPSVDERTLSRAFAGWQSQRLEFDRCDVDVRGPQATSICQGRVVGAQTSGSGDASDQSRQWVFVLRQDASGWLIERTEVRP